MANPLKKARFHPEQHLVQGKALASSATLVQIRGPQLARQQSSLTHEQPPLDEYFNSLFTALGPQHWWPGKTPFEVIVGAILTQNTSWKNVEFAIANLRDAGLLFLAGIERARVGRLAKLLRPSGYFRQKARKLKALATFLRREYHGSLRRMFATPTLELREKLLRVRGLDRRRRIRFCCTRAGIRYLWWMLTRSGCWRGTDELARKRDMRMCAGCSSGNFPATCGASMKCTR
jgi:hypothetical protein